MKIFLFLFSAVIVVALILILLKKIKQADLKIQIMNKMIVILSVFISSYLSTLILISSIKAHNPIDSRLLSPVYIPGLILMLILLQALYNRIDAFKNIKLLKIIFYSLLILGIVEPVWHTIKVIENHYNNGEGYSGRLWRKEEKKRG